MPAMTATTCTDDDLAFIEAAFARSLGRAVDPSELRTSIDRLRAGLAYSALERELTSSDEGRLHAAHRGTAPRPPPTISDLLAIGPTADFIERAYCAVTGAAPSTAAATAANASLAAGQSRLTWLVALRAGSAGSMPRAGLEDVHRLDLSADEFAGRASISLSRLLETTAEGFVHLAYWGLFGRAPDACGRAAYLRRLQGGERRLNVLDDMRASAEGRAAHSRIEGLPALAPGWLRFSRRLLRAARQARPKHGTGART